MRKLYLANGNEQFKFADTTTEIRLNAFDDGGLASLTADAKVRIKNGSGYLLEVSASVTKNQAVITSGQLAQLPVGSYLLELWDTVDGGTAIYPSDGFLRLQINENATGISGELVSSITVNDFIQHFNSLSQQLKKEISDAMVKSVNSAEVVDARTGYDGTAYDTLGTAIRSQVNNLNSDVDSTNSAFYDFNNSNGEYAEENYEYLSGKYFFPNIENGYIYVNGHSNYACAIVKVNAGEKIYAYTRFTEKNFLIFSDSYPKAGESKFVKLVPNTSDSTTFSMYDIEVPKGARYLIVNQTATLGNSKPIIKKIKTRLDTLSTIFRRQNLDCNVKRSMSENLYNKLDSTMTDYFSQITKNADSFTINDNGTDFWRQMVLCKIPVKPNTTYTRNCAYHPDSNLLAALCTGFIDENGKKLGAVAGDTNNANNGIVTFTTPNRCEYVLCGVYRGDINKFILCEGNEIAKDAKYESTINEGVTYDPMTESYKKSIDNVIDNILDDCLSEPYDFAFAFFTDSHVKAAEKNIGTGRIINYVDSRIPLDYVVFGGDVLQHSYSTIDELKNDVKGWGEITNEIKDKLLYVQGNHETYYYIDDVKKEITSKEADVLFNRRSHKKVYSSYSDLSYYVDFEKIKIRALVLDWRFVDNNVLDFVRSAVNSLPAGYLITLYMHYPFMGESLFRIIKDKCIGVFAGHEHKDWLGTKYNFTGDDVGINMQLTANDSMMEGVLNSGKKHRVSNDISCHAIDIVTVNKETKTVKSYRIGGVDNYDPSDTWNGTTPRLFTYTAN